MKQPGHHDETMLLFRPGQQEHKRDVSFETTRLRHSFLRAADGRAHRDSSELCREGERAFFGEADKDDEIALVKKWPGSRLTYAPHVIRQGEGRHTMSHNHTLNFGRESSVDV